MLSGEPRFPGNTSSLTSDVFTALLLCSGANQCEVFAHGAFFGDPCPHTFKQLKLVAICGEITAEDVQHVNALHYVHADDQVALHALASSDN